MNLNSKTTHILFIALIIVIVFSNSLKSDFAWDDEYLIINNPYVKDFSYIGRIFTSQLYEGSEMESNFYRPFQLISLAIDYSIWKLNPFGYHLANVLLHIINSALVYSIVVMVSCSPPIAFLAALMFGVSPAISGVTYYIPARADLLMALFVFLSILYFIRYIESRRKGLYVISIISFILSLLCKEMAMILPFLLVIEAFRASGKNISLKHLLPYFIVLFLYIVLRVNFATQANGFTGQGFPADIPLWRRGLTDLKVIVTYIRLLLFPSGLHMERYIKPARGLFEIGVFASAVFIASLAFIIRSLSRIDRIFLYAAAWFSVCLLPVLNIYPISVFLHEMWLYLPSMGFYIFFSAFIVKIIAKRISRVITILFIALYVTYCGLTTISYGRTWHDSISLFNNNLKYDIDSPFKCPFYINMAIAYYNKGEFKKSIECCKKSILLNPRYAGPYNNLGIAYVAIKRPVKAMYFFKRAIQLKKDYVDAYCNLGHVYRSIGSQDRAIEFSRAAIKINPGSYKAYCNLGYVYSEKKDEDKAIEFFKKAISIRKEYYEPHYCMGNIYIKKNNYPEALYEYREALKYGLDNAEIYSKLGLAYIKNNMFKEAEMAFRYSLNLNNNQSEPHNNLGNLYSMFGYLDLAIEEYSHALKIDQGNKGIVDNIEKVKNQKKQALMKKNAKR